MQYIFIFALLTTCALASEHVHYSFSQSVGDGDGTSFSITGEGRITAIRVWETYSNYIYGIQFRYGGNWSIIGGYTYNTPLEMELYEGERIVEISGKYSHYIQSLVIVTNLGRSLHVGQPYGHSFNMYPTHKDAELRFISGRLHGGLTSLQAHWATFHSDSSEEHS
ncbi:zymogen granule membrane protein 16 [Kryptolebias marmoratus]|uniref:Zymogen granule membrane protein 16-like n=1 Tax=Kryptolebias marmoratus TaxID=37003 RepID=A0A3Q2ZFS6_KRYMA|nr:zymogen granule membrane protein 16 [Kryptolebias marmoratus]